MNKYLTFILVSSFSISAHAEETSTASTAQTQASSAVSGNTDTASSTPGRNLVTQSGDVSNSALMQSTTELLKSLERLSPVDIDKDLLLWGFSYSLEAGTGDETGQAEEEERFALNDVEQDAGELGSALRLAQDGMEGEFTADRSPTRFGLNQQGDFQAAVPLFAAARTTLFSERRASAYQFDADVLAELTPAYQGGSFGTVFQLGFNRLSASGKKYFSESISAFFLSGGLSANGALTRYANDAFTYNAPMSLSGGVGMGRILNIEPRLRLLKLERMFQQAGIIKGTIPHAVGRDIMIAWWSLKNERGYDQRMLHTLKIIQEAGLMVKAPHLGDIYRFGQIFNDTQLVARRFGFEAEIRGRVGFTVGDDVDPVYSILPEVSYKQILNKTYDKEITLEPILGYALDTADRSMNTLPSVTTGVIPSSVLGKDIVISVPVTLSTYRYDEYYNRTGATAYSVRASAGMNADDDPNLALTFSSRYSVFRAANTAINFGLNVSGEKKGSADMAFSILATASYQIGAAESYYVAPVSLSEQLPVELPVPLPEYANMSDIF